MDVEQAEVELRGLMTASLGGDAAAHHALLTALSTRLRAYFRRRLHPLGRDASEAEDLVQETLLAVHTRRHTYDPAQPFTPWMYGIARYKFLDHLRRTKRSLRHADLGDAAELLAHEELDEVESTIDLERLMTRLPPAIRDAIRQVKLDGLSVREAAARSGRSESAVKVSIHRGVKTLSRLFRKDAARED